METTLPVQGGHDPFWTIYELYHWEVKGSFPFIGGISWGAMPRQIPSLIALFLVVTFGSALDVAAIQSDTPFPLDFNAEMVTVGAPPASRPLHRINGETVPRRGTAAASPASARARGEGGRCTLGGRRTRADSVHAGASNILAGAVGAGMTGSYIFSQTIFSMRAGVTNRLHGAIVAVMELALFFLPISVISYMPTLFYGAALSPTCLQLLVRRRCVSCTVREALFISAAPQPWDLRGGG